MRNAVVSLYTNNKKFNMTKWKIYDKKMILAKISQKKIKKCISGSTGALI